MILAVDIGNTNIVFGVYDKEELKFFFRAQSVQSRTTDEYATTILPLFSHNKLDIKKLDGVIISSVVPQICFTIARFIRIYIGIEPIIVSDIPNLGINIRVDNPKEVGSDRLVNVIAGKAKFGYPSIVIDFGTATTLDIIDCSGDYIGGIICPGIKLSAQVLHHKTASLPEIDIVKPKTTIGKNTIHAMQSGVFFGYLEMVSGLLNRVISEEFKSYKDNVNIILTGGLGSIFINDLSRPVIYEPYLTLYGLKLVLDKFQKNKVA